MATHSPTSPSCQDVAERILWLLNGSLTTTERSSVLEHLETCASCQRAFAESRQAWQLMTGHVPSLALAEFAQGIEPREVNRELIEQHVALCPSCREELELAMDCPAELAEADDVEPAGSLIDFTTARQRRQSAAAQPGQAPRRWNPAASWRRLAAAAVILMSLTSVGMILKREGTRSARHGVAQAGAELPSAPDATAHAERAVVFSDGFESGELPGWSLVISGEPSRETKALPTS